MNGRLKWEHQLIQFHRTRINHSSIDALKSWQIEKQWKFISKR